MNEHHETSSNPYEDEQQIPYASWEEGKAPEQEKEVAPPPRRNSLPQPRKARPESYHKPHSGTDTIPTLHQPLHNM
jgi:hypothetical protein